MAAALREVAAVLRSELDRELVTAVVLLGGGAIAVIVWLTGWLIGPPDGIRTSDGKTFVGESMTVAEAARARKPGRHLVRGYLTIASSGEPTRLCSYRGEGSECGSPSLAVERLGLHEVWRAEWGCCDTGAWTTYQVVVRGRIRDGELVAAPESAVALCGERMRIMLDEHTPPAVVGTLTARLGRGRAEVRFVSSAERAARVAAFNRGLDWTQQISDDARPPYLLVKPATGAVADLVVGSRAVTDVACDRADDL
jgi:hypothetical protein